MMQGVIEAVRPDTTWGEQADWRTAGPKAAPLTGSLRRASAATRRRPGGL